VSWQGGISEHQLRGLVFTWKRDGCVPDWLESLIEKVGYYREGTPELAERQHPLGGNPKRAARPSTCWGYSSATPGVIHYR
jgi:hypothetical protein